MIQKADEQLLLMKQNADNLLAKDEKLQDFLSWYNHISVSLKVPYKPASIRAFYLDLEKREKQIKAFLMTKYWHLL